MALNKKNRIHSVIFDLDGTLADTAILTIEAFRIVAPEYDMEIPSLDRVRSAIGYADPEFYEHIYPGQSRELVHRLGQSVEKEEQRLLPLLKEPLLFPGCLELLQALQQKQVPMYIASTGSHEHVDSIMEKTGILEFFEDVHCNVPDKTGIISNIIRDDSGFIMVGDMKKDCDGAHANGILAVGACYGYCIRGKSDFDLYIDDPMELLQLIHNFEI